MVHLLTQAFIDGLVVRNMYLYDSGGQLPSVKLWKCDEHDEFAVCEENKDIHSIETRGERMTRTAGACLIGRAMHEQ